MSRRRRRSIVFALPILLGACGTDPLTLPIVPVTSVVISGRPADGVIILGQALPLAAVTLGYGDIPLADRLLQWRSSTPSVASVDADGVVLGVALGTTTISARSEGMQSTIPAEVREGVLVPAAGPPASASLLGGLLELSVPTSVAAPGTAIHARVATTWPPDDRLVPATVVEIGPAGTELAAPILPGIAFEPTGIPAPERPNLRLFATNAAGQWVELPGGGVDLAASRVSADMSRLTTVAVFRRATPTALVKIAGDLQVVPRGTAVPVAPVVEVRDAAGRPVSGIAVTFALGGGGGQLTGSGNATSGIDGRATISGQWRMGSSAGTYTLTATIAGGVQVTFTATATP